MNEDWPMEPAKRQEAIEALMVAVRDPALTVDAFKALVKADEANMKRQALALKQQEIDEARRLRLLEFARSLQPDEIARLASSSGVCIDAERRADEPAREDGTEAG